MASVPNVGLNQVGVFNATMPREGGRVVPFVLDFGQAGSYTIDFTLAVAQGQLSQVQCVWVDNSTSTVPTLLTVNSKGQPVQTIHIPPYSQGTFPVLAPARPAFLVANPTGAVVTVAFVNVPLPSAVWTVPAPPVGTAALFPAFHTIAAGGTAVSPFAGTILKAGGFVTNPLNATESLWIDLYGTAGTVAPGINGTTFELVAGQTFSLPAGFGGTVSVNAATGGHTFSAVAFA